MSIGLAALPDSVGAQRRLVRRRWRLMYAHVFVLALVSAGAAYISAPHPFSIALLGLILCCAVAIARPVVGLYAAALLTMVGDTVTVPWYPFTKNLSSRESILFLGDGLTMNPFEITILLTTVAWILRMLGDPTWRLRRGALWTPMLVFLGFVFLGLLQGLRHGGDRTVAVWESRPLLYIPLVYVLITNLLTTRRQYERLFMCLIVGVVIQSLLSLQYLHSLDPEIRDNLESLTEHAASIHIAVLIVMVLAAWLLPRSNDLRRIWMTLSLVPCLWMFVVAQRRAAAIALIVGVITLGLLIYQHRRWAAVWFLLFTVVFGAAYTLAFWNSTGSLGFAAQAVKTVIAPGQLSAADQSSDLYRQVEAFNIWYSIRSNELLGLGFGQRFLRPAVLPDISFFVFADYMPHNSVLWIWIKMGVGGFMAMLYLIARTIHHGVRSVARSQSPDLTVVFIGALVYVLMYMVYSYVDIGWDIRSTVFLAVSMAICADLSPLSDPPPADEVDPTEEPAAGELELVS